MSESGELPQMVIDKISDDEIRNVNIVQQYVKQKEEFGKTIVFAINRKHAVMLNKLFNTYGIKSNYVICADNNSIASSQSSNAANRAIIKSFKNGDYDVLINVNMLTEGSDIPNVKTVFLTRPTSSKILLTQMIGRALRGEYSGGTPIANIVSFISGDWLKLITWATPGIIQCVETDKDEEEANCVINETKALKKPIDIAIVEKVATELSKAMQNEIHSDWQYSFNIPIGFYSFSYKKPISNQKHIRKDCHILVYDSDKEFYERFFKDIENLFKNDINIKTDIIDDCVLGSIYDSALWIKPSFSDRQNLIDIMEYYYYTHRIPIYTEMEQRDKMDVPVIAKEIIQKSMSRLQEKEYIENLWSDKNSVLKILFSNNKVQFFKMLENELQKLVNPEIFVSKTA